MPEIAMILIALLIVIVSFGMYFILMELSHLRAHLHTVKQRQEQYYFEVMNRLKMLSVALLSGLKESCIAQERYEDANRLNELLEKDYKECFKPEEKTRKEK